MRPEEGQALLEASLEPLRDRMGKGARAREFLEKVKGRLAIPVVSRVAWACYRTQSYDCAFDLFAISFLHNVRSDKFFSALETAADRCGRLEDLEKLYEAHAEEEPRLHGRLKGLRQRWRGG